MVRFEMFLGFETYEYARSVYRELRLIFYMHQPSRRGLLRITAMASHALFARKYRSGPAMVII